MPVLPGVDDGEGDEGGVDPDPADFWAGGWAPFDADVEEEEEDDSDFEPDEEDDGELGLGGLGVDGLGIDEGDDGGGFGICGDEEGDFVAHADTSRSVAAMQPARRVRTDAIFMMSLPRSTMTT